MTWDLQSLIKMIHGLNLSSMIPVIKASIALFLSVTVVGLLRRLVLAGNQWLGNITRKITKTAIQEELECILNLLPKDLYSSKICLFSGTEDLPTDFINIHDPLIKEQSRVTVGKIGNTICVQIKKENFEESSWDDALEYLHQIRLLKPINVFVLSIAVEDLNASKYDTIARRILQISKFCKPKIYIIVTNLQTNKSFEAFTNLFGPADEDQIIGCSGTSNLAEQFNSLSERVYDIILQKTISQEVCSRDLLTFWLNFPKEMNKKLEPLLLKLGNNFQLGSIYFSGKNQSEKQVFLKDALLKNIILDDTEGHKYLWPSSLADWLTGLMTAVLLTGLFLFGQSSFKKYSSSLEGLKENYCHKKTAETLKSLTELEKMHFSFWPIITLTWAPVENFQKQVVQEAVNKLSTDDDATIDADFAASVTWLTNPLPLYKLKKYLDIAVNLIESNALEVFKISDASKLPDKIITTLNELRGQFCDSIGNFGDEFEKARKVFVEELNKTEELDLQRLYAATNTLQAYIEAIKTIESAADICAKKEVVDVVRRLTELSSNIRFRDSIKPEMLEKEIKQRESQIQEDFKDIISFANESIAIEEKIDAIKDIFLALNSLKEKELWSDIPQTMENLIKNFKDPLILLTLKPEYVRKLQEALDKACCAQIIKTSVDTPTPATIVAWKEAFNNKKQFADAVDAAYNHDNYSLLPKSLVSAIAEKAKQPDITMDGINGPLEDFIKKINEAKTRQKLADLTRFESTEPVVQQAQARLRAALIEVHEDILKQFKKALPKKFPFKPLETCCTEDEIVDFLNRMLSAKPDFEEIASCNLDKSHTDYVAQCQNTGRLIKGEYRFRFTISCLPHESTIEEIIKIQTEQESREYALNKNQIGPQANTVNKITITHKLARAEQGVEFVEGKEKIIGEYISTSRCPNLAFLQFLNDRGTKKYEVREEEARIDFELLIEVVADGIGELIDLTV